MNVSGVKVKRQPSDGGRFNWGPLDRLYKQKSHVAPAGDVSAASIDHLFMEGQLSGFSADGPEATYEALRLEGYRYKPDSAERSGVSDRRVHVYDMFWSDLSGVAASAFRIFGELYQILFHLGSVGVNNVRAAALSLPDVPAWRTFSFWQKWAASGLAWPIPFFNLILFALAVTLFVLGACRGLTVRTEAVLSAVVCLLAVTGAVGMSLNRFFRKAPWTAYALSITVPLVLAGIACFVLLTWPPGDAWREASEFALGAVVLDLLGIGVFAVVNSYDKRRPSTRVLFIWLSALWFAVTLVAIASTDMPRDFRAMYFLLRGLEVGLLMLGASWFFFWIGMLGALVAGKAAVGKTAQGEKSRAERTNWTARLTLVLPTSLFLLLTFAVWAGILKFGIPLLPAAHSGPGLTYSPLTMPGIVPLTVSQVVAKGYLVSGIGWLPAILGALVVAALFSLWAFFPSVLAEISPPTGDAADLTDQAEANGAWLSNGFRLMRWGGRILYLAVFLFFPFVAFVLWQAVWPSVWFNAVAFADFSVRISAVLGVVVAGAAVSLLGFSGSLSKLALGLRPIVRVALDVDNWLRENPRGSNPTARISARFVSLLRFVLQWRDENGCGYDAIVIFSHSQGAVVVTDVLRYLHVEAGECGGYGAYDESLARMDGIGRYLLTMGCPLRQLYGRRFPYLYGYCDNLVGQTRPLPDNIGLRNWTNAYRSSDYVGRSLWSDGPWEPSKVDAAAGWNPSQGIPQATYNRDKAVEYPIGIGAHTHYWDATGLPIALILDELIAKA